MEIQSDGQQSASERTCSPFRISHSIFITCKSLSQVAMMTFVDVDGSVQPAAVASPLEGIEQSQPQGLPVILTFHGTGVGPRSQVEAYKQKIENKGDYIFGVAG
jgi:hypothetical protein